MSPRTVASLALAVAATLATAQMDGSDRVKVTVQGSRVSTLTEGRLGVAVAFDIEEDWHIYWKNPGDSGAPPSFDWKLPEGFKVLTTRWQAPHRIVAGGIVNYGYERTASVWVEFQTPKGFDYGDKFAYELKTDFLVCKDLCLSGSATAKGEIVLAQAGSFVGPPQLPALAMPGTASYKTQGDEVTLTFELAHKEGATVQGAYFFAANEGTLDHAHEQKWTLKGPQLVLAAKRSAYATKPFSSVEGVLVVTYADKNGKVFKTAIEYAKKNQEN